MDKSFLLKGINDNSQLIVMDNYSNDFGSKTKVKLQEDVNLDVVYVELNDVHNDANMGYL